MTAPFDTLLLSVSGWDLTLDSQNNIAITTAPYSVAQDMSSQCRQYQGDYIYNASDGVPYQTILGKSPSLGVMKSDFVTVAAAVPGTSNVRCFIQSVSNRLVTGQIQATVTAAGTTTVIAAPISGAHTP
jgi:hypothetical protein